MARQQTEGDELFDVKNNYYIGNYQQCINEAQKSKVTSLELVLERDVFMYRAYIAQGKYRVLFDEIKPNSNKKLQHLRMLADYKANPAKRPQIIASLEKAAPTDSEAADDNDLYRLICATIYYEEGNLDSALEYCFYTDNLECKALSVQIYYQLHRPDLARIEMKKMVEKDDDATITQLVQAWVYIFTGGEKIQDAYYIYQELVDKYGETSALLNGQAVAFISQGKYKEAEEALQDALGKDPNDPDTLINMIVLSHHQGKSDVANRYLSQLKDLSPNHRYVKNYEQKKLDFQRFCKSYAPSVTASA
ncbi:coatomer subunit epsilon [Chrysoperla carnea]|uniref:coatomer subunit epsilon n=1 Tax=Chrysoperla carnea TaxID=189513 RepID=UPI001D096CCD|nr:coatomer subunit epsilon [Chrysoperla carnea]